MPGVTLLTGKVKGNGLTTILFDPLVEPDATRVACPRSTEAFGSNPFLLTSLERSQCPKEVIPEFYPIERDGPSCPFELQLAWQRAAYITCGVARNRSSTRLIVRQMKIIWEGLMRPLVVPAVPASQQVFQTLQTGSGAQVEENTGHP